MVIHHPSLSSDQNQETGSFFTVVPQYPPYYIRCTEALTRLDHSLTLDKKMCVAVIQGWPGSGKSVLAAAYVRRDATRRLFPDGIFWWHMGPEADSNQLFDAFRCIGAEYDDINKFYDYKIARSRLSNALAGRRCLIVLDDVWDKAHADVFFNALDETGHLLITTRKAEIAREYGVRAISPGSLDRSSAVQLLAGWAGREQDPAFTHIAQQVGHLPLALRLAGALMRTSGEDGATWLARFSQVSQLRLKRHPQSSQESLALCYDMSIDPLPSEDKVLYRALAIFRDNHAIPQAVIFKLWQALSQQSLDELAIHPDDAYEMPSDQENGRALEKARRILAILEEKRAGHTILTVPANLIVELEEQQELVARLEAQSNAAGHPRVPVRQPQPLSVLDCEEVLRELNDNGLVERDVSNPGQRLVIIHDLLHQYNHDWIAEHGDESRLHEVLLDTYNPEGDDWWNILDDPGGYLYQNLAYHLLQARRSDSLYRLLLNYRWLNAKLQATDVGSLIGDLRLALNDNGGEEQRSALTLILGALELSAHVLAKKKAQLWHQLYGRLMEEANPQIVSLLATLPQGGWLRPLELSLTPPNSVLENRLFGNEESVCAIAVAPTEKFAVAGLLNGRIDLWDLQEGTLVGSLTGHQDEVTSVAIAGDGKLMVSGSVDHTVRLWDIESKVSRGCLCAHEGSVMSVAISDDGRVAVSGEQYGKIIVWDLETHMPLRTLSGHLGSVTALAMSKDGHIAVSGSFDRSVRVWDVDSGQLLHKFSGHDGPVGAITLSHDHRWVISGGADRKVRVWDIEKNCQKHVFELYGSWVRTVALSSDSEVLIYSGCKGCIDVRALPGGELLRTLCGHDEPVTALAFMGKSRRFLSGGYDGRLNIWNLTNPHNLPDFMDAGGGIMSVSATMDGDLAASTYIDRKISLWDTHERRVIRKFQGHTNIIQATDISPDGRMVSSSSYDKTVRVWDTITGRDLWTFSGHQTPVMSVAIHPGQKLLASGSIGASEEECIIRIWSLESGEALRRLSGHVGDITSLRFARDGSFLLSSSNDHTVKMWDHTTGQVIRTFEGHTDWVKTVDISSDGSLIVSGSNDQTIRLWRADGTLVDVLTGHTGTVWMARLSRDGTKLLSASRDHSLKLWDVERGRVITEYYFDNLLQACAFGVNHTLICGCKATNRLHFLRLEGFDL